MKPQVVVLGPWLHPMIELYGSKYVIVAAQRIVTWRISHRTILASVAPMLLRPRLSGKHGRLRHRPTVGWGGVAARPSPSIHRTTSLPCLCRGLWLHGSGLMGLSRWAGVSG